jgi:hypothetical protein
MIEGLLHSPLPAKAEAASNVQIVIDTYGDFRKKSHEEETGTIENFLETMGTRCAAAIETLGATEWMVALDGANKAFDVLMRERFDEHVGETPVNIRLTRREMEPLYDKTVFLASAMAELNDPEGEFKTFTERLNARIAYYNSVLAQRKGRGGKKDGGIIENF